MAESRFLSGPERVRNYQRIAYIFGSNDLNAAENALESLLQVFAMAGKSEKIEVSLHPNASVTITSYDGGIYLGEIDDVSGGIAWKNLFCNLYNELSNVIWQMYKELLPSELSLSVVSPLTAVQYACSRFEVNSIRHREKYCVRFENGHPKGVEQFPAQESPRTIIHLDFDHDLFDMGAGFSKERIDRMLRRLLDYSPKLDYEVLLEEEG